MLTSSLVVFLGLGLGWRLYGNKSPKPEAPDALEKVRALALGRCATASTSTSSMA